MPYLWWTSRVWYSPVVVTKLTVRKVPRNNMEAYCRVNSTLPLTWCGTILASVASIMSEGRGEWVRDAGEWYIHDPGVENVYGGPPKVREASKPMLIGKSFTPWVWFIWEDADIQLIEVHGSIRFWREAIRGSDCLVIRVHYVLCVLRACKTKDNLPHV